MPNKYQFNEYSNLLLQDLELRKLLFIDISNIIDLLIPIKEHYRIMKSRISTENYSILKYRAERYTLQEIGEIYGVTRERIRQRESKVLRDLQRFVEIVSCILFTENDYLLLNELEDLFEEEDMAIIEYLFIHHKDYKMITEINKVVSTTMLRTKEIKSYLYEFFQEDFLEEEYLVLMEEELKEKGIAYLDAGDLNHYFLKNNFTLMESTYIRLNSYINPYLYVIKTRFKQGIELFQLRSSDDYQYLKKITSELFPSVKLVDNNRAIYARLSERLISIDRSIMIHPDNLLNYPTDMKFIVNYMEELDIDTFSFTELYDKHENKLNDYHVNNRYLLRSLLQLGYSQNYKFTRDFIIKRGGQFISPFDNIINKVLEHGRPIYSKELRKIFPHLSDIMFYSPLYNSTQIINWGHGRYIHKNNLRRIKGKNEIKNGLTEEIKNKGVLSTIECIKVIRRFIVPHDFYIDNNLSIEPFINYYFKDDFHYKHGMVHLYLGKEYKDYKSYLGLYFGDIRRINVEDLELLAKEKQLSYNNKQNILDDIARNYLRVDNNEFVNLEYFTIRKEDIDIVKNEIADFLEFENIVSPINLVTKIPFPNLGFNWNEYSLISFIRLFLNEEFKFIPTGTHHTLTRWGVIIFIGKAKNISEVIFNYLKQLGITRISEHELYKHLMELNIINGRIPHEVYEADIFKIRGGIVQLLY